MARDADINQVTAKNWLQILERLGIIFYLHPYSNNQLKRVIKAPKLYFFDSGLVCYLGKWSSPETPSAFVFLLPYCKSAYYITLMQALHINNTQIGLLGSVYGIAAMVSYLPGGWLADLVSARKLLATSFILTGLGGFYLSTYPPYIMCLLLYAFWGVTATLTFFGAFIKATRNLASMSQQGKAFGFLDGGRGLIFAATMTIGVVIFARLGSGVAGLTGVLYLYSSVVTLFGIFTWFALKDNSCRIAAGDIWPQILKVLRLPYIWLIALVTFCSYSPLIAVQFITPLAMRVYGGSAVFAATLYISAQYIRPFASCCAGLLADRAGSSKVILYGMIMLSASLFSLALAPGGRNMIPILVIMCAAIYATMYFVYSVNYTLLEEGDIPAEICGTAVGVIATLGYLPDVLVPFMGGRFLDAFPGAPGYKYFFTVIAVIVVAGFCATLFWLRLTARKRALLADSRAESTALRLNR